MKWDDFPHIQWPATSHRNPKDCSLPPVRIRPKSSMNLISGFLKTAPGASVSGTFSDKKRPLKWVAIFSLKVKIWLSM
jgi:hypothetical protein